MQTRRMRIKRRKGRILKMFCLDVILKLEGTNYNKTEKSPPKYHVFMRFNSAYKYDTSVTARCRK